MRNRFNLRPKAHLHNAAAKQELNLALFSEVAPKYDFITRALSLGRDAVWKQRLIKQLPALVEPSCVDLACGTGDLTRLLADRFLGGRICGIDLTPSMLDIARERSAGYRVDYLQGTMNALPFEDSSTDIVTGGYALRNAPELEHALREIARILRPGGAAAFLDFSKPASRLGQATHHNILRFWGGFWGLALHGNPDVYGYIADSLETYPDRRTLQERFEIHGLAPVKRIFFYGGLIEITCVKKG